MNNAKIRFATVLTSLVLGASLLAGCSETPQEKYDNAVEQLKEARESRNEAQEALNEKKEELNELQANLNESENELQEARQKVAAASEAVNKTVNDQVLFRTIQRDVLNEKSFDKSAISVGVKDRVVTLTGVVPDEETRELALEKARSQAGVEDVVDELQLEDEQGEPRAPSAGSVAKPDQKAEQDAKAKQAKPEQAEDKSQAQPAPQPESGQSAPQQPESNAQSNDQGNTQSKPQGDTPKPPMAPNDGGGSASATQARAHVATA
ncbi:BON domain-containing protein [Salinisphaera sp.]|uniref:BON domain-containing protein n=1 Tax=Salinisphaera sp. TaxID=1914330 RepID=UPI0025E42AD2|nr:BON domain-containing protein [Salinisphaera sp.]